MLETTLLNRFRNGKISSKLYKNKGESELNESKVVLIIIFILTFMSVIIAHYLSNKIVEKIQLEKAEKVVNIGNQNEIEIITKEELNANDNIIGTFEIPRFGIIAPIKEGSNQEILKVAVGHFTESSLWEGNVALASHNRSIYAHYFERINELQNGDEIIYKTKLGIKKYAVYENRIIESTDWSVIENTKENIITLITCVKNNTKKRLCVRAKEIIENVNIVK
jgi:LPXTG-site transpeptidase (sortase) family protein